MGSVALLLLLYVWAHDGIYSQLDMASIMSRLRVFFLYTLLLCH